MREWIDTINERFIEVLRDRRTWISAAALVAVVLGIYGVLAVRDAMARTPPNIFDSPVQNVAGYLAGPHFNSMSVEERMAYIRDLVQRFSDMNQSDSAVLAGFLAGLTGPAREQLTDNARHLVKDILVAAAEEYLSLEDDAERAAYLDQWLIDWIRMGEEMTGRASSRTDEEILGRIKRGAQRDTEREIERRGGEVTARQAQQFIDFWQSEIEVVASPREQGQILHFLPALRDHLIGGE